MFTLITHCRTKELEISLPKQANHLSNTDKEVLSLQPSPRLAQPSARPAPSPVAVPGVSFSLCPAGLDVLCELTSHLLVCPGSNTSCAHNAHTMHLDLSTLSFSLQRAEFWHLYKICLISPSISLIRQN